MLPLCYLMLRGTFAAFQVLCKCFVCLSTSTTNFQEHMVAWHASTRAYGAFNIPDLMCPFIVEHAAFNRGMSNRNQAGSQQLSLTSPCCSCLLPCSDLGCHIDGFIATQAQTVLVAADTSAPITGRAADVVQAARTAFEAAIRLIKPGRYPAEKS